VIRKVQIGEGEEKGRNRRFCFWLEKVKREGGPAQMGQSISMGFLKLEYPTIRKYKNISKRVPTHRSTESHDIEEPQKRCAVLENKVGKETKRGKSRSFHVF